MTSRALPSISRWPPYSWNTFASRMLKKSASFVLGSSKSSTYPRGYASGFDSPAALLNELFEHPADHSGNITLRIITAACCTKTELLRKLLMGKTTQSGGYAYLLSQPGYCPCR